MNKKNPFRLTVIVAIAAASVLGCNPPTNPPPTPVQPRTPIKRDAFPASMSYAPTTVSRGSSISVPLTGADGVTASYVFDTSGSNPAPPSWLTIDSNTGILSVGNVTTTVPADAPFGTTTYKIKAAGTDQYSAIAPKTLDFALTVQAAPFPEPLGINIGSMLLNDGKRSGTASIADANDPKLTVTYAYARNHPNTETPEKPGWLDIDSTTGAITVTNAPPSAFLPVEERKIYKIRITGTGIYEGRTADIDFVTRGEAIDLPVDMGYTATIVKKGSSTTGADAVKVLNAAGVDAKYAFDTSGSNPTNPGWLTINEDTGAVSIGPTAADPSATVPWNAHNDKTTGEKTYKIKVTGRGIYQGKTTDPPLNFKLKVESADIGTFTYSGSKVTSDPGRGLIIGIPAANTALTPADLSLSSSIADINKVTFSISKTGAVPTGTEFNAHTGLTFNTSDPNKGKITGTPSKVFTEATYVITATGNAETIYEGATPATKTIHIKVDAVPIGTFTYRGNFVKDLSGGVLPITVIAKNAALTTAALTNDLFLDVGSLTAGIANVTFSISKEGIPNAATDFNTNTNLIFNTSAGSNKGKITGTPNKVFTAGETYTITAIGDNNTIYEGATATKKIRIKVNPAPFGAISYSDTSALQAMNGIAITPRTITAPVPASHSNVTYQIDPPNLTANTGLDFNEDNGTISGTPTTTVLSRLYTIKATGTGIYQGYTKETTITIGVVDLAIPDVSYSALSVEKGSSGKTHDVSGAPAGSGLTYALAAGEPAWLSIDSSSGRITVGTDSTTNKVPLSVAGSPVGSDGSYTKTVTVNVNGGTGTYAGAPQKPVTFNLKVTPAPIPINTPTEKYPDKTIPRGSNITASFPNSIGAANVVAFSQHSVERDGSDSSGEPNLTLAANGNITGPVIPAGTSIDVYTYTIKVTGKDGTKYEGAAPKYMTFKLTVIPAAIPDDMTYSPGTVKKGSAGSRGISGAPSTGLTYAFAAVQPGWLSINSSNGRITIGTVDNTVPASAASSTIAVNVNGAPGSIYEGATQKTVTFALTVTPATIPDDMVYSVRVIKQGTPAQTISLTNGIDATYTQQPTVEVSGGAVAADAPRLTFGANGAITNLAITDAIPAGRYKYTIRVTPKTSTIHEGASPKNITFSLTVTRDLPTGMGYATGNASRWTTTAVSEPLYFNIGSAIPPPSTITADQANFSVVTRPAGAPVLAIDNVGRVSTTVDSSSTSGDYIYTIRITGKGIYAGSTRDVTFRLNISG